jgi:hypothetical protein
VICIFGSVLVAIEWCLLLESLALLEMLVARYALYLWVVLDAAKPASYAVLDRETSSRSNHILILHDPKTKLLVTLQSELINW